jgi:hypothetical protein
VFAIILAIIAIALTIAASVATLMYLGDDGQSAAKAEAARIIQEAAQIRGAILIARNDGVHLTTADSLEALKPKYLADIPQGSANWGFSTNQVYKTNVRDTVCLAANLSMGKEFKSTDTDVRLADDGKSYIPYCDNENLDPNVPCCDNSRVTATP